MLRTLSARSEQGNAIHTTECNNEAALKLVPEDVQKTMRDSVLMGAKKAAVWVNDCSEHDTELDVRFAVFSNSLISGEHWTVQRLVCVPRDPEPNTDEWDMVEDFYKMMFREAQWAGVTTQAFEAYLKGENLV